MENNDIIINILNEVTLEEKIKTTIIMNDYDNWENGEYLGKAHLVVPEIMELIYKEHANVIELITELDKLKKTEK